MTNNSRWPRTGLLLAGVTLALTLCPIVPVTSATPDCESQGYGRIHNADFDDDHGTPPPLVLVEHGICHEFEGAFPDTDGSMHYYYTHWRK